MNSIQWVHLLAFIVFAPSPWTSAHHEIHYCGVPEIPDSGSISPSKDRYEVGESVLFTCLPNYFRQGANIGICLENETWSINSPRCELNVAYGKPANGTKGPKENPPQFATDGDEQSCAVITSPPSGAWNVNLQKIYKIESVLLQLEPGSMYNLAVAVYVGNKFEECGKLVGDVYNRTSRVDCKEGIGLSGQFVRIQDHRHVGTLKICEVIIVTEDERKCGEPEKPTHMITDNSREFVAKYRCATGYRMIGETESRCVKGRWQTPPRCLHVGDVCGFPGSPNNGNVNPYGLAYSFDTTVTYNCADGFTIVGSDQRTCEKDGAWSLKVPRCERNLALQRNAKSARGIPKPIIVDGNIDSCDRVEQQPYTKSPAALSIELERKVHVRTVTIIFREDNRNYSVDVTIANKRSDPQPQPVTVCGTFQGLPRTRKLSVTCNANIGDTVTITNTDRNTHLLVLCEVQVATSTSEVSQHCGEPEVPLHAKVLEVGVMPQEVSYSCPGGYRLVGTNRRTCRQGSWDNSFPECDPLDEETTSGIAGQDFKDPDSTEKDEKTEHPMEEHERDPTVVVGVMGIALGVTAASVSILCAVITIVVVMKKCRKKPRSRITSQSTEDSSRASSRRNANWEDASLHYYDTVKDSNLPTYSESSCSFPQRGQLPAPSPQYDIIGFAYDGRSVSVSDTWAQERRKNLPDTVTTV